MANRAAIAVLTAAGSGLFALVSLAHGDAAYGVVAGAAAATGVATWLTLQPALGRVRRRSAAGARQKKLIAVVATACESILAISRLH